MAIAWGHDVIKLNEDDLRVVFDNRPPHLTFSDRMNRDKLAAEFTKENIPKKPYNAERIDAVQRHWGRVPKGFLDRSRIQQQDDKTHKARGELLSELAGYVSEQNPLEYYSAEQIMQWIVSCSVFKPSQIMTIRDHRPSKFRTEGKPRIRQSDVADLFNLSDNEVQQVWTRSRRLCEKLGSFERAELPSNYLRTTVASWSEETLWDMMDDPKLKSLSKNKQHALLARAAGVTYAGLRQFLAGSPNST